MEAGFKCLLSVLQLGAEPGERERRWQHLIQGADVRGSTLIRETLALGFSKEPQRLSAMCWNEHTKVRGEKSRAPGRAGGGFLQAALATGTRPCAASVCCPGPQLFQRGHEEGKATLCQVWCHLGSLRGAQVSSAWLPCPAGSCQVLWAENFPACPLPLPEQGWATGLEQSWKLGTEAGSSQEPSLLLCVRAGFCAAVGSANMFPICLPR